MDEWCHPHNIYTNWRDRRSLVKRCFCAITLTWSRLWPQSHFVILGGKALNTYIHTITHTRTCTRTRTHARTHAHTQTHAHTHTHTHTHIHTHVHTYSHTCTWTHQQFSLPNDVQSLFAVEILLAHPRTKNHLGVTEGEIVFVLLISHYKLPEGLYLAEKQDGTSGSKQLNITHKSENIQQNICRNWWTRKNIWRSNYEQWTHSAKY